MREKRLGLFGGTFNPIHCGHLRAAEIVQKEFSLDKVLFIPSYIPPHKERDDVASPSHRLEMIKLTVSPFPRFVPSSVEIDARGKSYSILTIKKIIKMYDDARIFFILGIDAFIEIETWHKHKSVLEQCSFVVISRPGYRLEEAKKVLGKEYSNRIRMLSGLEDRIEDLLPVFSIFLLPIKALDIASTDIRRRIKSGRTVKGMVTQEVESYIKENGLYR